MSDGATIGALRFVLGADSAQLDAAAARASASLRFAAQAGQAAGAQIAGALNRIGGMVASAFAVESIIRFGAESLQAAASLGRFAEQAGLSTQQFQGLEHALRDAHVPAEQLAQGFAIFSRNMSDLQRGGGPFLDFLRRFAPEFEAQFRAAGNTSEAFGVLTDAVNSLGNQYDRVRLLTAAGSEQFTRLASVMRHGRAEIEAAAAGFSGLTDAQVRSAQDIERRWDDMWRRFRMGYQRAIVGVTEMGGAFTDAAAIETEIAALERIKRNAEFAGLSVTDLNRRIGRLRIELEEMRNAADNMLGTFGRPVQLQLSPDQLKLANAELQRLMGLLQVLPPRNEFVSQNFRAAWERMAATIRATADSEELAASQIATARLNLLRQEDQARQQVLGGALLATEALSRRETEIHFARSQQLITETELQRLLNFERFKHAEAQLQTAQSLGAVISPYEQFEMQLRRIDAAHANNAISAQMAARAHQQAGIAMVSSYAAAAANISSVLSGAFQKNKALATANAIVSTFAAVMKSLETYGATPWGYAAAAAALAAGIANVAKINSTTETSKSVSGGDSGSGAGGGQAPTQSAPAQTLMVQGIDPNAIFTGDQARALAERLIQYQRDGGMVVVQ